ncbi:hypothetical protein HanPSC8_Chr15g0682251 [Helianthus annuus]|nr:hypothetical protein HanPSC8_Chr15g0682251 [Helianthus annuus]
METLFNSLGNLVGYNLVKCLGPVSHTFLLLVHKPSRFFFFLFNESLFGLFPTHNSTQLDTFIIPKLGFHPFRSLKNLKASSSTASHYYQSAIQDLPKDLRYITELAQGGAGRVGFGS